MCIAYAPLVTNIEFVPNFVYNSQCSSALLLKFIPVYLYSYCISLFMVLAMQGYLLTQQYYKFTFGMWTWLRVVLPRVLWDFDDIPTSNATPLLAETATSILNDLVVHDSQKYDNYSNGGNNKQKQTGFRKIQKPLLLNCNLVLARYVEHTANLIIFGVACPYLCVTILIYMYMFTSHWRLIISRYLSQMTSAGKYKMARKELNLATATVTSISFTRLWNLLMIPASIMFGLLLLDITSDDRNFTFAFMCLLFSSCLILPFVIRFVYFYFRPIFPHDGGNSCNANMLEEDEQDEHSYQSEMELSISSRPTSTSLHN